MNPSRGEIWLVGFDPQVGSEIAKVRPAVVINSDEIGRLPLRIVVPITDWKQKYVMMPWFVNILPNTTNNLVKSSAADSFQVKSLSIKRFIERIGSLSSAQIDEIAAAIALCVGYDP